MKVVVAENDPAFGRALEGLLSQWGHDVTLVPNGSAALQVLQEQDAPKLAVLDQNLPDMNSIEVCRQVRRQTGRPYVYLLILADETGRPALVEALNAGADGCLRKSLEETQLQAYFSAARRILDLQDELVNARENLREQATHDSLTRLWNHAAILEILKRELDRSQRTGEPLGVIMADVDHFKRINDTHGHQAGDQVLGQLARRLESTLRPYDAIGRYGGEEFLMVLPGCDTSSTLQLADRLRRAVGGKAMVTPEAVIPVTLSLGVSSNQEPYLAGAEALLRGADTALYRAKHAGRNRIECAIPADVQGRRSG